MRGNRGVGVEHKTRIRSIPAYAGEPQGALAAQGRPRVYPRVCGGTDYGDATSRTRLGLSPRMRGNRTCVGRDSRYSGSIPAYAGEPIHPNSAYSGRKVYPRVCGGTIDAAGDRRMPAGLSPRMRGNLNGVLAALIAARSIPAYAGEPICSGKSRPAPWVYPRVCGGTAM